MNVNKQMFLNELDKALFKLSYSEKKNILNYYEELIEDYKENGCSEEEAVARLEEPKEIADRAISESQPALEQSASPTVLVKTLIILGSPLWVSILLAGAMFILSILIIIWCLPIITVSFAFASVVGAFIGIFGAVPVMITTFLYGVFQLGVGIFCVGLSYWTIHLAQKSIDYSKSASWRIIDSVSSAFRNGGYFSWIKINGSK